jgi:hypothetical protein
MIYVQGWEKIGYLAVPLSNDTRLGVLLYTLRKIKKK